MKRILQLIAFSIAPATLCFGQTNLNAPVGIGTTTPAYPLDVVGDVRINGNIGIGINPSNLLPIQIKKSVVGTAGLRFENTSSAAYSFSAFQMGEDINATGTKFLNVLYTSNGTSTYGFYNPQGSTLVNNGSGGLSLATYDPSGSSKILFYTGSNVSASPKAVIDGNGRLGVGTTTPSHLLSIGNTGLGFSPYASAGANDALKIIGNNTSSNFGTQNLNPNGYSGVEYIDHNGATSIFTGYKNGTGEFRINNVATDGHINFMTNSTTRVHISNSGSVGIGTNKTSDANYKLFVETGIRTRKVKVDQLVWADYVFESSYRLPTLQEVEKYIKEHKHLPDVPSAKEVEEKGLDLGDNQAVLLRKIEELTLYIIEMKKEIAELQQKVANK